MVDRTGDGFCGAMYYSGGHVKVRKSLLARILTAVGLAGIVFITFVVIGSMLNVKPAQKALETLIAGN